MKYNIKSVNRKQFHFLVIKFLQKRHLLKEFIEDSNMKKRGFNGNVSEYIYYCIDIYIGNEHLYNGKIYGFFRFIPATNLCHSWGFWRTYSDRWEFETYDIGYIKDTTKHKDDE